MNANLIRRYRSKLPSRWVRWVANWYRPFRGAGIEISHIAPDWRQMSVKLRLRWFNRNYVGTQFGGSIYAMTDPFYMLMLMNILGDEYIVWDKEAHIRFLKPGRGDLSAKFELTEDDLEGIRAGLERDGRTLFRKMVRVVSEGGEITAEVEKIVYLRRKAVPS